MFKPPIFINTIESIFLFLRVQILRFTYPKYFHHDPVDYQALPFSDVLDSMTFQLEQDKSSWTLMTSYLGDSRPTNIILLNGFDPEKPTLIYHHGAGSIKPLKGFYLTFGHKFSRGFNVFIVHAQYHTSKQEYLDNSVDSFLHNQETFAGSVLAYEEIIKYHQSYSKQLVVATGSSMGGIVSALHAFYFGYGDYYFPIVAYPNVGEIFMGESYKTAVADWESKHHNESYQKSFEIKEIDPGLKRIVFPILGSADHIVPFAKSSQFWLDNGFTLKVFPYGHFTPGIAGPEIRKYISDRISSMRLNQPATDFSLPDQDVKFHSLSGYRGKWVVLYFYPKDDTPGCTAEACNFRDSFHELQKIGVVVLGVSKDSVKSHKKFADKYNLNFPILSDEGGEVHIAYNVTSRMSYLINLEGNVVKIYEKVNPLTHAKEIIDDLKSYEL